MEKSYFKKLFFVLVSSVLVIYAMQKPSAQAAQSAFEAYDFNPQIQGLQLHETGTQIQCDGGMGHYGSLDPQTT